MNKNRHSRRKRSRSSDQQPTQSVGEALVGIGNAAVQSMLNGGKHPGGAASLMNMGMQQLLGLVSSEGEQAASAQPDAFMQTNLYAAMVRLVEKEGWDPEFAASWLGQAVVETGKENLEELDVVERGSGAGRGMLQYTGARRRPYDRARNQALRNGQDPNDINWQIDYALNTDNPAMDLDEMRRGLTDPEENYQFHPKWGVASGRSPAGVPYGNRFNDANSLMASYGDDRVAGYTRALTGEYTRPGEPHMDRRLAATRRILSSYQATRKQGRASSAGVARKIE